MSEQQNMQVAREAINAWNAHDPDRLIKLLAEDYVSESDTLPAPVRGRESARGVFQMYLRAFPDLHFEMEQLLPSGNYVVTRWHATGTHGGELMGVPATNRRAETHGCSVVEYRDGQMVRELVYWDTGNLLRQLGVLPAPGGPSH